MSFHFCLSATNSLHLLTPSTWKSLSTSSFIFSWVFPSFSSLPVLKWRTFWASYPPPFSLGDLRVCVLVTSTMGLPRMLRHKTEIKKQSWSNRSAILLSAWRNRKINKSFPLCVFAQLLAGQLPTICLEIDTLNCAVKVRKVPPLSRHSKLRLWFNEVHFTFSCPMLLCCIGTE